MVGFTIEGFIDPKKSGLSKAVKLKILFCEFRKEGQEYFDSDDDDDDDGDDDDDDDDDGSLIMMMLMMMVMMDNY